MMEEMRKRHRGGRRQKPDPPASTSLRLSSSSYSPPKYRTYSPCTNTDSVLSLIHSHSTVSFPPHPEITMASSPPNSKAPSRKGERVCWERAHRDQRLGQLPGLRGSYALFLRPIPFSSHFHFHLHLNQTQKTPPKMHSQASRATSATQ